MHKSWQFETCQQALQWHTLAQAVSDRHGRDRLFYLGHVGSGRIETDFLNPTIGYLTSDELAVAMMLNTLERQIKSQSISPSLYVQACGGIRGSLQSVMTSNLGFNLLDMVYCSL